MPSDLEALRTVFFYVVGGLAVVVVVAGILAVYSLRGKDIGSEPRIRDKPIDDRLREAKSAGERQQLLNEYVSQRSRDGVWEGAVAPDRAMSPRAEDRILMLAASLGERDFALMSAVRLGSKETVEALIAAGADPNRKDWAREETPLGKAISHGHRDIVRTLLDHGADVRALNGRYDPGCDDIVAALFDIGKDVQARDLAKAATGVELSTPDSELRERSGVLGSLFVAFAERFAARGEYLRAKQLCEWKIKWWRTHRLSPPILRPEPVCVCLRMLAGAEEADGRLQEALRHYRRALRMWRTLDFDDGPVLDDIEVDIEVIFDYLGDAQSLLVDPALVNPRLQWTRDETRHPLDDLLLHGDSDLASLPETLRAEFAALLIDCERILGRLGMLEEQGHVAVALQQLERVSRPAQ